MTENETVEYWTRKINVEQKEKLENFFKQREQEIIEKNRTSKFQTPLSFARVLPQWLYEESVIPVYDYEILQKNNVHLTGLWSCVSGTEAYLRERRNTILEGSSWAVAVGTPIVGFYKIIDKNNNDLICYYNRHDMNEFVSQEIQIYFHQLFNPDSIGNKSYISIGDILHVKSIELINNKYSIKWEII